MGHYYSEMHVVTPNERYLEALDQAVNKLGFHKIKIEFTTLYTCYPCGCMVYLLRTHCAHCPARDRTDMLEHQIAKASELIKSLTTPIKRMDIVSLAQEADIDVFALHCAIESMQASKEIVCRGGFRQYEDKVITPAAKSQSD